MISSIRGWILKNRIIILLFCTPLVVAQWSYTYNSQDFWLEFIPPEDATHFCHIYQTDVFEEQLLHDVIWIDKIPDNNSFYIRAENGLNEITFKLEYYLEINDHYKCIGSEIITYNLIELKNGGVK